MFQSSEDFFNLVTSNMGRALEFFVYNSDTDKIRTVTLTPNKEWGGSGRYDIPFLSPIVSFQVLLMTLMYI